MSKELKYWAVRFVGDPRYRITSARFASAAEAAKDLYGVDFSVQMRAASFGRKWRSLTISQKSDVEVALGLPRTSPFNVRGRPAK